jgi:hypothetical protein
LRLCGRACQRAHERAGNDGLFVRGFHCSFFVWFKFFVARFRGSVACLSVSNPTL